jgi:hypothetical protein
MEKANNLAPEFVWKTCGTVITDLSNFGEEFKEPITDYSLRAGGGPRTADEVCNVITLILRQM